MSKMPSFAIYPYTVVLEESLKLGTDDTIINNETEETTSDETAIISSDTIQNVNCSLYDSVSDLKRSLQLSHGDIWGLEGRKKDRDGLYLGWEIIHNDTALSYHLFLNDYNVRHGDEVYVVVEKNEEKNEDGGERRRRKRKELRERENNGNR